MKTLRPLFAMLFLSLLAFLPISCGGGGGGGGGVAGLAQVLITSTNADAIAENAFENSNAAAETGRGTGGGLPSTSLDNSNQGENQGSNPYSFALAQSMMDFLKQADIPSGNRTSTRQADNAISTLDVVIDGPYTLNGTCAVGPGSVSFTITYDDQIPNAFSLTADFNDYCTNGDGVTGGVVTDGIMVFAGELNQGTNVIAITMTFNSFNTRLIASNVSATMSGTMALTGDLDDTISFTMDMVMSDDSTGKIYEVEDLIVSMFDITLNPATFTMAGRFHDPDYGYSDISTPTPFTIWLGDNMPSGGVLVVTGANGVAGGSTKARLTIISNTTYRIEADIDGDGAYDGVDDYDSGVRNW